MRSRAMPAIDLAPCFERADASSEFRVTASSRMSLERKIAESALSSRELIRLCAAIIRASHRDDLNEAQRLLDEAN